MRKKKPSPRVILLDSCSYFRLAISYHPILIKLDDDPRYVLKVSDRLEVEYNKNPQLKSKFWWANFVEFKEERCLNTYKLSGKKSKDADVAFSYISEYASSNQIPLSFVDIFVLSVATACAGIVVTDDVKMQEVARVFDIDYFSTLDLLKLLLERKKITLENIDTIIDYWKNENDLPTSLKNIVDWRESL